MDFLGKASHIQMAHFIHRNQKQENAKGCAGRAEGKNTHIGEA